MAKNKKWLIKSKEIIGWKGWKKLGRCFLLMLFFLIIFSQNTLAQWGLVDVSKLMATAFYKLAQLSGLLLGMAMWCVNLLTSADFYNSVFFSDGAKAAINLGWKVVRDFLNLFFILILLLIAISTILRVPSYGDKKRVFNVVIAALLINFSKSIALVFIDISQLAMSFFMEALNGDGDSLAGKILTHAGLKDALGKENVVSGSANEYIGYMIIAVTATIFFLVMAVMLFVLAATLVVRVVAFWILIILSPLAMFGLAMPGGGLGNLQRDWFRKMLHWSFFGPLQLFFLWLAVVILSKVTPYTNQSIKMLKIPEVNVDNTTLILKAFEIIVPYVAAVYLLFYGYDAAKSVSVGGAQKIMNWGSRKIGEYGRKLGKWSALGVGGALATTSLAGAGLAMAGAATYYGGRYGGRVIKDYATGLREKLGEGKAGFIFRTKQQREEKEREKREERIARIKGGEDERKYWRGRANKLKKEWEDLGVEDKFLQEKMKKGNQAEKKAAALLLAERGRINTADGPGGFRDALKAIQGDKILEANIRKKLKEDNIYAYMTYDIDTYWDIIQKTADRDLYEKLGRNDFILGIAKNEGVDTNNRDAIKSFLKSYKKGLSGKNKDTFKQSAYNKQLDELTPKQIASQNNLLYEREETVLRNYFAEKMSFRKGDGGTKSRREFEKELDRQSNGWRSKKAKEIVSAAQTDPRAMSR